MRLTIKNLLLENRGIKQTIFKNTFWLLIAEMFTKGVNFLVVVWLARHFGPDLYGQWAFALSFAWAFSALVDFGFGTLTVREIARDKTKTAQYIDNILIIKLILGLIALGLIALVIQFLGKESEVIKLVYFLGIYTVLNTFAIFLQSIFRANEKMQYETICRVMQSVSLFGLVAFFAINNGSIIAISYSYIGAVLIGILFSLLFIWHRLSKFFLKIELRVCIEIIKKAWPFGLSFIINIVYLKIGIILLSLMKIDMAVGWYNAAHNLVFVLAVMPTLLMVSVYPNLSVSYQNSFLKFQKLYRKSLKLIFLVSIVLFPILFIFSKQIILFIYGTSYKETITIFKILIWAQFFGFIGCVFSYSLMAMNKQIDYMKVKGISLIVNIGLCLILIPRYSCIGLSVTLVITEFLITLFLFIIINKANKVKNFVRCNV